MPTKRSDQARPTPFGFSKLESLRLLCRQIQQDQVASLNHFRSGVGFVHISGEEKNGDISVSSSATCVLSLVATGEWKASKEETTALAMKLLEKDTSAKLEPDNPFTTAWILDAVTALELDVTESFVPDDTYKSKIEHKEKKLREAIEEGKGAVSIAGYPGSPYLTQLVVRVLRRRKKLEGLGDSVNDWAWRELTRQLALVQTKGKPHDAFAFAYLLMLVSSGTPTSKISPERRSIQRACLRTVFAAQLPDGTWPLSRPLFHYPKVGNAHCYEFEMLTQLLHEPELMDLLLGYLPNLSRATESLVGSVYRLDKNVQAWASGHHPQLEGPESWTTASVYHFLYRLDRLLAEAARRELFRYLEQPLPSSSKKALKEEAQFAPPPGFLDSRLDLPDSPGLSLRRFLWEKFVEPLALEADAIANGRRFQRGTPTSAIFFGPPGTSKTELSKKIAEFLGWPLLTIDPSHLLRRGMDGIQGEANSIFRMLEETEGVVVLFDEFDELVRERGSLGSQPFSRLLTTAMLPKLTSIHKRASLVFIIATNHIGEFDLAIRRRGRFDRVVQVMPPTYDSKIAKTDWGPHKNLSLKTRIDELKVDITEQVIRQIGDLTFDECEAFVIELYRVQTPQAAATSLAAVWNQCTLQTNVSPEEQNMTWADRSRTEAQLTH